MSTSTNQHPTPRAVVRRGLLACSMLVIFCAGERQADADPRIYVDATATGVDDGSSWADAYVYLQNALADPSITSGTVTEIWVAAGSYKPDQGAGQTLGDRSAAFVMVGGVTIYGGFAGGETTIGARDHRVWKTSLSGDIGTSSQNDNSYHVITNDDASVVRLDGFTIRRGNADGATTPEREGGAIYNDGGVLHLANCSIVRNHSAEAGGAIANLNGGMLKAANMRISHNTTADEGGAISCVNGTITLVSTVLSWNSAEGRGGAIASTDSTWNLTNCMIIQNEAQGATANPCGGILSRGASSDLTVANGILWGNQDGQSDEQAAQVYIEDQHTTSVQYTCVQGGFTGTGNIADDPLMSFGSPTATFSGNSPILGAGNTALVAADAIDLDFDTDTAEATPLNFDGSARDQSAPVSMGVLRALAYGEGEVECTADNDCYLAGYCCGGYCCSGCCVGDADIGNCEVNNACCGTVTCDNAMKTCCHGQDRCCPIGEVCCGGPEPCCPVGETCCGDICCPAGQVCCGPNVCCAVGEDCQNDECETINPGAPAPTPGPIDHLGREFIVAFLPNSSWDLGQPGDHNRLSLLFTSPDFTSVHVRYPVIGLAQFEAVVAVTPTQAGVLTIPERIIDHWEAGQIRDGLAVLAYADQQFSCVLVNDAEYLADAALALPTDALGTDYFISSHRTTNSVGSNSHFAVVAVEDNTQITITPVAALDGDWDGTGEGNQGVPFNRTLNRGQTFLATSGAPLTGSQVSSINGKRFAVIQGNNCVIVPFNEFCCCDSIFDFAFPRDRHGPGAFLPTVLYSAENQDDEGVVGNEDGVGYLALGTSINAFIYRDDCEQEGLLTSGGFQYFTPNTLSEPEYSISSIDEPDKFETTMFSISQYALTDPFYGQALGDPSMTHLLHTTQYLKEHTFITAEVSPDPNYDGGVHHYAMLIASVDDVNNVNGGFLELDGIQVDPSSAEEVFSLSGTECSIQTSTGYMRLTLPIDEGTHQTESFGDHTVYVAGFGGAISYLYVAGVFFEQPPTGQQPTARITVLNKQGSELIEPYEIDECQVVTLSSLNSESNSATNFFLSEWDSSEPLDFFPTDYDGAERLFAWTVDGQLGLQDEHIYVETRLRVTNLDGNFDYDTAIIRVNDASPTDVLISGPDELTVGQEGCFAISATSPCDAIVLMEWDFEYAQGSFVAEAPDPDGDEQSRCISWTVPGTYELAVLVEDEDGDQLIDYKTVSITGANPDIGAKSNILFAETIEHEYEQPAFSSDPVTHRAQMRLFNYGLSDVVDEIYVAFTTLLPAGTTVIGDLSGTGGATAEIPSEQPYIQVQLDGERIEPGTPTPWMDVEWVVPQNSLEPLTYTLTPYAHQLPPEFIIYPSEVATEGELYVTLVEAIDPEGDPIYYELVDDPQFPPSPPAGMFLDALTGVLSWSPDQIAAVASPYSITIRAHDGYSNSYSAHTFSLVVSAVDVAPVFDSEPDLVVYDDEDYTYSIEVSDADGDLITLVLAEDFPFTPSFTGGSGQWTLSWIDADVTPSDVGTYTITLTAAANGKATIQEFEVDVLSCQYPPSIDPIPDDDLNGQGSGSEGLPYLYQTNVTIDPGSTDTIYHFLGLAPPGMIIGEETGLIQWLPSYTQHGPWWVRVLATTDPLGLAGCSNTEAFLLKIEDRNIAPEITSAAIQDATEGVRYVYDVEATDGDEDQLAYELIGQPAGMFISPSDGLIIWYPSQTAAVDGPVDPSNPCDPVDPLNPCNSYPFTVVVTDEADTLVTQEVTVVVAEVDLDPVIDSEPPTIVVEGNLYSYQVVAFDLDAQNGNGIVDYSVQIEPAVPGFGIDAVGLIEWAPLTGASANSPYLVTVVVTDETGRTKPQVYELNVYAPAPPDIPNNPPDMTWQEPLAQTAVANVLYSQIITITDPDNDLIDADNVMLNVLTDPAPQNAPMVNKLTGTDDWEITWANPVVADVPTGEDFWRFVFQIIADDGKGLSRIRTWSIDVWEEDPTNFPPRFLTPPVTSAIVGQEYHYDFIVDDPDVPGTQTLAYELVTVGEPGTPPAAPPPGMTIGAGQPTDKTRPLTWTPTADDVGVHWIHLRVQDLNASEFVMSEGLQSFALAVSDVGGNAPPQIDSVNTQSLVTVGTAHAYQVTVIDPDLGDTHFYELTQAPVGVTIHPVTGLVEWLPLAEQVGTRVIALKVTDRGGASDEQEYAVTVLPQGSTNTPPVFTSVPVTKGMPTVGYLYTVGRDDVETPILNLVLTIEHGPTGLYLASGTSNIQWDQPVIGAHPVRLRVTDTEGAYSEQYYTLTISDDGTNESPLIISVPPERAAVSQQYQYQVFGYGPDNEVCVGCTYSMELAPAGATMTSGLIQWTPGTAQVGDTCFLVRLTDSEGAVVGQTFFVTTSHDGQNHAPRIISVPLELAATGSTYQYEVLAVDDDAGDLLTYSVIAGPMAINFGPTPNNLLTWPTAGVADGTYPVTIRVTDSQRASTEQSFSITISSDGSNWAPRITSSPVMTATAAGDYSYQAIAADPDGDPLTWTIESDPVSSITVDTTGLVEWIPAGGAGTYKVTVTATESEFAFDEQTFELVVSADGTNRAPYFVTKPVTWVIVGSTYSTQVEAADPDGNPLVWTGLTQSPGGMVFDATGGGSGIPTITWPTVDPTDLGTHLVEVEVSDGLGGVTTQSFEIEVVPNEPTRIISTPAQHALVGIDYTYQVEAVNPNGNVFDYLTDQGSIDAQGLLTWTPAAAGDVTITVQAALAGQASPEFTSQTFTVRVESIANGDSARPDVEIIVLGSPAALGDDVTIEITALDDIALTGATLTITLPDGTTDLVYDNYSLTPDVNGQEIITYDTDSGGEGLYLVSVVAADGGTNSTTAEADFAASGGSPPLPPIAFIQSPIGMVEKVNYDGWDIVPISEPTELLGWALDPDGGFYKYTLEHRLVSDESNEFVTFETGYSQVGAVNDAQPLGMIDPTLMLNGTYEVRLTAWDIDGNGISSSQFYVIEGDLKIGNFTMSFQDMSLPLYGIPVTVTRTYDSRIKTAGEFGVGWKLEVSSLALEEYAPMSVFWGGIAAGAFECQMSQTVSHTVTIAWPGGQTETFEMQIDHEQSGLADAGACPESLDIYGITMERVSAGTSSLALKGGIPSYWFPNAVTTQGQGVIGEGDWNAPDPWEPDGYILTAADGTVYEFTRSGGPGSTVTKLTKVTDRNGNDLVFTDSGIQHDSGLGITFLRDELGRIGKIVDPALNEVRYEYNERGDLERVIDQNGDATTYHYNFRHELVEVLDARGIRVARNVYDDGGRLIETVDAMGYSITYMHDQLNTTETIKDRLGNETVFTYDEKGNIVSQLVFVGGGYEITGYEYDDRGNQTMVTYPEDDPSNPSIKLSVTRTYDAFDNLLTETDINRHTTTNTYNAFQQIATVTDPLGRLTTYEYDSFGNLERVLGPEPGEETSYTYDTHGDLDTTLGAEFEYTSQTVNEYGFVTSTTDSEGIVTEFEYDTMGRRTQEIRTRTLPDGSTEELVSQMVNDALGRVIKTIDPLGNEVVTTYNSIGKQATVTNANGTTEYSYDARGDLIEVLYPDGSTVANTYDAEARRRSTKDRDGRYTWTDYDELNRVVKSYTPDANAAAGPLTDTPFTETIYDGMGRVMVRYGERNDPGVFEAWTWYIYTPTETGSDREVWDPFYNKTTHHYDVSGQLVQITDAHTPAHEVYYVYDDAGRRTETIFDDTTSQLVDYDASGRKLSETDQAGKVTSFEYDTLGRLTAVVDAHLKRIEYVYDEQGNRTAQIDAEGRVTLMEYDKLGRLTARRLPLDGQNGEVFVETFTYDAVGNMISKTDFEDQTTTFEYDVNNRMTKKILPDLTEVVYDYTPGGQRILAGGDSYTYDRFGRLETETKASGEVIAYSYDAAGNRTLLQVTPAGGGPLTSDTAYTFDALNRMETVVDDGGTTTYTYDAVGNRESVTYPNMTRARYAYDTLNRVTSITNYKNAGTPYDPDPLMETGTQISSFTYTLGLAGNRLAVSEDLEGSVRTVEYEYDDLYRLTREFATEADLTTREQLFGYDDVGNRLDLTLVEDDAMGVTTLTHQTVYAYDDNDRLNSEVTTDYTPVVAADLPADSMLATAKRSARWSTNGLIGFGAASLVACLAPLGLIRGRRMGKRAYRRRMLNACVAAFFIPLMAISPENVQATHIEAMTARAFTAAAVGQVCGGVRCVTYDYFDNGNMKTRWVDNGATTDTDTFVYDYENRLISSTTQSGSSPGVATYTYDADGIRVSKTVDAAVHSYVIDKNRPYAQVIEESRPAFSLLRYVHGDDLISQEFDGLSSYYHYDGQMSVRQLTNNPGLPTAVAITDTCTYDAFGNELTTSSCGTTINDYRYTGEQRDANTGFYYLRARYMDPGIGRFVTRDPFQGSAHDPMSLHKYLYANASPVDNIDPTGLLSFTTFTIATTLMTTLIGIVVGYAVGGPNGAAVGAMIGLALGAFAVALWGEALFLWAIATWYRIAALVSGIGAAASSRYLQGPYGRVTLRRLETAVQQSSSRVTLWTRITTSPGTDRALHTATDVRLADAGGRAGRNLFRVDVPKLVIDELEAVGLVIQRRGVEVLDGVRGTELKFLPDAVGYITRWMQAVPE